MMPRPVLWLPLLLGAAACAADPASSAPASDAGPALLPALAADGARAAVIAGPDGALALRLDVQGEAIGSVQGEVAFDPAVLAASQVVPVTGAYTAINADELAAGRIRFATFSSGALPGGNLFALKGEVRGSLTRAAVRVRLDAAGTLEGRALERARLHGTEGVFRVEP